MLLLTPENFDEAMTAAAKKAARASDSAMREYRKGNVVDEDDITGVLLGELNSALSGNIRGFNWNAKILRHRRGSASEEKQVGADILIHTTVRAIGRSYSKGVLIQAKRKEPGERLTQGETDAFHKQCERMLERTPESYVFDYSRKGLRSGSATRIAGTARPDIYAECSMTAYRFFLNLFLCPFGDRSINSTDLKKLGFVDLVPNVIQLSANSELGV